MFHTFVTQYFQPFPVCVLLMALGIGSLWHKRRETRRRLVVLSVCFLLMTVLTFPAVGYLLRGSLEWQYAPLEQRPEDVTAIVVLGGGVHPPDGPRLRAELDNDSQNRCLRAVEVYLQGSPCPILVSGGKDPTEPDPACAELMRDFLVQLGVSAGDVIVENQSRTTFENAVESRKVLDAHGWGKIVLVTDVTHLGRALGCFRKQGIDALPCGCQYRSTPSSGSRYSFLPSPSALQECQRVWHEWLGLAWYRLTGKI
jgi:uncharacterized SAM-binding protein YcdF (DUF218 family)